MGGSRPRRSGAPAAGGSRSSAWRPGEGAGRARLGADRHVQTARRDNGRRRHPAASNRIARGQPRTDAMTPLERIRNKQARIGVIGLGYVGLPLAVEFARAGFDVTGFDVDAAKTAQINAGKSYIPDVAESDLAAMVGARKLRATTDMTQLGTMDAIDICVPTPLRKTKDPDLSYVVLAVEAVAATLRKGRLIILESTTYPLT